MGMRQSSPYTLRSRGTATCGALDLRPELLQLDQPPRPVRFAGLAACNSTASRTVSPQQWSDLDFHPFVPTSLKARRFSSVHLLILGRQALQQVELLCIRALFGGLECIPGGVDLAGIASKPPHLLLS